MYADLEILLWRDLAIFLMIGASLGVVLGLLLIFWPQLFVRVNRAASRWISLRPVSYMLDRSISTEKWFFQHHRISGVAAVSGALYVLVYFVVLFDKDYALHHMNSRLPLKLLDGLLDALVLSALTGAVVALVVGLFLWFRPSMLRGVERYDQWVSSRHVTKVLDVPRDHTDRLVARHARPVGWLMLLGSIYLFFAVFRLLV